MTSSVHELPEEIVLTREEYRLQHAALEAALDALDRFPTADVGDVADISGFNGALRRVR